MPAPSLLRLFPAVLLLLAAQLCAAEPITRSPRLPETTPWDLQALSQAPQFEWVDRKGPVRSLLYAGEPYEGKPTQVFAYYATPGTLTGDAALDKKLPAVVLVHGGGGTAFSVWAELWAKRGYAAIAMDLAGSRPVHDENGRQTDARTRLINGGPNQNDEEKFGSIDKPPTEQWPYHAVASVLRAHSLIRSFEEVDADRTAVTGISWGGYLTCIVAGVDNRFKAAVPVYGCGFLHDNSVWLDRFAKMTPEQRDRWVSLWDPSRYLPGVSMPILFVNGTNDFAYPLDSYMKCFELVPGKKQLRVSVNLPHGHPQGWAPPEIGLFIDQYIRGGDPLPVVEDPQVDGEQVKFTFTSPDPVAQAALHFTTEDAPINKRNWKTVAAKIEGKAATVAAPPANATAWFVTVTDARGAVVSSRIVIAK